MQWCFEYTKVQPEKYHFNNTKKKFEEKKILIIRFL